MSPVRRTAGHRGLVASLNKGPLVRLDGHLHILPCQLGPAFLSPLLPRIPASGIKGRRTCWIRAWCTLRNPSTGRSASRKLTRPYGAGSWLREAASLRPVGSFAQRALRCRCCRYRPISLRQGVWVRIFQRYPSIRPLTAISTSLLLLFGLNGLR